MIDQLLHVQHVDNPNDDPIEHGLRSFGHVLSILFLALAGLVLTPSKVSLNCVKRALCNRSRQDDFCDSYGSACDLAGHEGRRAEPNLGSSCNQVNDPRTRVQRRHLQS